MTLRTLFTREGMASHTSLERAFNENFSAGSVSFFSNSIKNYLCEKHEILYCIRRERLRRSQGFPELYFPRYFLVGNLKNTIYKINKKGYRTEKGIANTISFITPQMLSSVRQHFYYLWL